MLNRKTSMQLFCEEPFRIFFPVGMLLAIAGVSLWIFYYGDILASYPGTSHARLMIEGFMASFIIGFLGTAGPRITSTRHFSKLELLALLSLDLFAAGLHFGGSHRAGDALFSLCLMIFLFVIGKRFIRREDSPPPNFALVALGLLNGIIGAMLVALFEDEVYSAAYRGGRCFLNKASCCFRFWALRHFCCHAFSGLRELTTCRNRARFREDGCPELLSPQRLA